MLRRFAKQAGSLRGLAAVSMARTPPPQSAFIMRAMPQVSNSFHSLSGMDRDPVFAQFASQFTTPIHAAFSSGAGEVVQVPTLGDSITEGTLINWTKAVGDYVDQDEIIAVLETDKVSVDIRAPAGGVVMEFMAEEGDTVEVGADLIAIDTSAAKPEGAAAPAAAAASPDAAPAAAAPPAAAATPAPAAAAKAAAPPSPPAPARAPGSREESRVPMTRMRQTIAGRLKEAQNTAAMLTTFNEIDMSGIMGLRKKHQDDFVAKHGTKLGFMSIFVKASAAALQAQPDVNATIDGKDIVYKDYVDISVAVGTPTGLVVPVLRNCEDMSFSDVEKTIASLGQRARAGQIALEDMVGGTFTISNGGVYGSLMGTPIINPPQSAILGMHGIFDRPVAVNGEVVIKPMMYVALTYDHRIIDGGGAVTFLKRIKSAVEDPTRLLLDI